MLLNIVLIVIGLVDVNNGHFDRAAASFSLVAAIFGLDAFIAGLRR